MAADAKKSGGLLVAIGMGPKKGPMADGDAPGADEGDDYEHDEGTQEMAGEVRRALKGTDDSALAQALCNFIDNHLAMKKAKKMAAMSEDEG